jgi:glutathione S-transferase
MLILVIGDKHRSSWSLRPWILLRHLDLPFEEFSLPLDTERFRDEIGRYSPTQRVPVLIDGSLRIWDSLAICEYVNEMVAGAAWPADPGARAVARSISTEMHSGFAALRRNWPLQSAAQVHDVELTPEAATDVARIDTIWSECDDRRATDGPWLFGRYSIADAMYAPVVLRFHTYGARLSPGARRYYEHALGDPCLREWIAGARREIAAA